MSGDKLFLLVKVNVDYLSPFQFSRLRAGNVIFNYRYYNNKLQRTEGIYISFSSFVL